MKVAFVGCSHFAATEQPSQGLNNWTFRLAERFSQHTYRNYSMGGRGIEYYQYCLLDAKRWGADTVFINRTYPGRWSLLAQMTENPEITPDFEFTEREPLRAYRVDYREMLLSSEYMWGTVNNLSTMPKGPVGGEWDTSYRTLAQIKQWSQAYIGGGRDRIMWEREWYKNVVNLYNFRNIFLIDWADTHYIKPKESPERDEFITSNVNPQNVVAWFCERFRATGETVGDRPLYSLGITTAEDDNHLTPFANNYLLDNYILKCLNVYSALDKP